MTDLTEVRVPDIGDHSDVPVIEVLVAAGDRIRAEDPLVTVESDKATMDVPSPVAGTVARVALAVGDHVSQGSLILTVESVESAPDALPATAQASVPAPAPAPTPEAPEADRRPKRPIPRRPRPNRRDASPRPIRAPPAAARRPLRRSRSNPSRAPSRTRLRRFAAMHASSVSTRPRSGGPAARGGSCARTSTHS